AVVAGSSSSPWSPPHTRRTPGSPVAVAGRPSVARTRAAISGSAAPATPTPIESAMRVPVRRRTGSGMSSIVSLCRRSVDAVSAATLMPASQQLAAYGRVVPGPDPRPVPLADDRPVLHGDAAAEDGHRRDAVQRGAVPGADRVEVDEVLVADLAAGLRVDDR